MQPAEHARSKCLARSSRQPTNTNIQQTHALHLAHLNFYTALSHDTLAREATLKNRWKELSLAEVHYNAAILAVSPLQSPAPCDPWSPNSSTTTPPSPYSRRPNSIYSNRSAASSATSLGDPDQDEHDNQPWPQPSPNREPRHARIDSAFQIYDTAHTSKQQTVGADTTAPWPARPQTPQQFYFSTNMASFVRMMESHLFDVRERKDRTSVPTVRFRSPELRRSPTSAKTVFGVIPRLSVGGEADEAAMEAVRESRRNVRFRRRFDAQSTQRLCNEALAELIE